MSDGPECCIPEVSWATYGLLYPWGPPSQQLSGKSHPWRGEGSRQPPSGLLLEWKKWIQGKNNDLPYIFSLPRTKHLYLLTMLLFSHFPLFPVKDTLLIYAPFYWDVRSLKRSLVFALQSAVDLWLLMSLSPSHPGSCMFASLLRNRVLESWET